MNYDSTVDGQIPPVEEEPSMYSHRREQSGDAEKTRHETMEYTRKVQRTV